MSISLLYSSIWYNVFIIIAIEKYFYNFISQLVGSTAVKGCMTVTWDQSFYQVRLDQLMSIQRLYWMSQLK